MVSNPAGENARRPGRFPFSGDGLPKTTAPSSYRTIISCPLQKRSNNSMDRPPGLHYLDWPRFFDRLEWRKYSERSYFSERSSPFSFAGPKRFTPPGLGIKDLPRIDVIIISHNHYDSFDGNSRALSNIAQTPCAPYSVSLRRLNVGVKNAGIWIGTTSTCGRYYICRRRRSTGPTDGFLTSTKPYGLVYN